MKEKDLRSVVDSWLEQDGYQVGHELLLSGYCDVIAFIFAPRTGRNIPSLLEVIAIELKIKDIARVISQAKSNRYFVDKSFAAMPANFCSSMRCKTIKRFKKSKVGLLSISDTGVEVIVPAVRRQRNHLQCDDNYSKRLQRKLWRYGGRSHSLLTKDK